MPDILVLVSLILVRHYLKVVGQWDYVKIAKSLYDSPCLVISEN